MTSGTDSQWSAPPREIREGFPAEVTIRRRGSRQAITCSRGTPDTVRPKAMQKDHGLGSSPPCQAISVTSPWGEELRPPRQQPALTARKISAPGF